jgi:polysaccharide export outer membrane protein
MQATEMIRDSLRSFVKDPLVLIRIMNFKVTVIGEVQRPGTFTIPNERITIPEALGMAGDMNITGLRKNVLVIRDVDGKKTQTRVDMTSTKLLSSPVYYLMQNDVIYVEPNRARVNSSAITATNAGVFISVVSLVISTITLLSR